MISGEYMLMNECRIENNRLRRIASPRFPLEPTLTTLYIEMYFRVEFNIRI